jgi:acetolactate synthase-1/2/3 large subunit
MARAGATVVGPQAQRLIGLTEPALDWVSLAKGLGVAATRVETGEELALELERALADSGPRVIEAIL